MTEHTITRRAALTVTATGAAAIVAGTAHATAEEINQLYVTLEQFGGGTDKTGAENNAAYTAAEASGPGDPNTGPTIRLGRGTYTFAGPIQIKRSTSIIGLSTPMDVQVTRQTTLHFPTLSGSRRFILTASQRLVKL